MELCSPFLHVYAASSKMLKCKWTTNQQMTDEHLARLLGVSRSRSGCGSSTETEKQKLSYFRGWHVNQ